MCLKPLRENVRITRGSAAELLLLLGEVGCSAQSDCEDKARSQARNLILRAPMLELLLLPFLLMLLLLLLLRLLLAGAGCCSCQNERWESTKCLSDAMHSIPRTHSTHIFPLICRTHCTSIPQSHCISAIVKC